MVPAAARLGGPRALAGCIGLMALFHGPMMPAATEMKRNWLPAGPERAWGTRLVSLGGKAAGFATVLTPWLASSQLLGWAGVHYLYGLGCLGFSVLWHLSATDRPMDPEATGTKAGTAASTTSGNGRNCSGTGKDSPAERKQLVEWRIFRVPSAQVVILMHIASNNVWTTLDKISFTYFDEVLGCSPVRASDFVSVCFSNGVRTCLLHLICHIYTNCRNGLVARSAIGRAVARQFCGSCPRGGNAQSRMECPANPTADDSCRVGSICCFRCLVRGISSTECGRLHCLSFSADPTSCWN